MCLTPNQFFSPLYLPTTTWSRQTMEVVRPSRQPLPSACNALLQPADPLFFCRTELPGKPVLPGLGEVPPPPPADGSGSRSWRTCLCPSWMAGLHCGQKYVSSSLSHPCPLRHRVRSGPVNLPLVLSCLLGHGWQATPWKHILVPVEIERRLGELARAAAVGGHRLSEPA